MRRNDDFLKKKKKKFEIWRKQLFLRYETTEITKRKELYRYSEIMFSLFSFVAHAFSADDVGNDNHTSSCEHVEIVCYDVVLLFFCRSME